MRKSGTTSAATNAMLSPNIVMKKPKVIWGLFRQLIRSLCVF